MSGVNGDLQPADLVLTSADSEPAPPLVRMAIVAAAAPLRVEPGQLLLAAGAPSRDVYLVLAGRLRVTSFSSDGREVIIRDLGPGEMFGELAAIDGRPRSAAVVALSGASLLAVPDGAFRRAVLMTGEAGWFARHLVATIRRLTDRLIELSTLSVRARLHCQILRLATEAGIAGNESVIEPAPSHEELADMIGTHREAVTRELSYLASTGLLKAGRRRLRIHDVAALEAMVRKALGT